MTALTYMRGSAIVQGDWRSSWPNSRGPGRWRDAPRLHEGRGVSINLNSVVAVDAGHPSEHRADPVEGQPLVPGRSGQGLNQLACQVENRPESFPKVFAGPAYGRDQIRIDWNDRARMEINGLGTGSFLAVTPSGQGRPVTSRGFPEGSPDPPPA